MNRDKLYEIAVLFRHAIEEAQQNGNLRGIMRDFPRACCGQASTLLRCFLYEKGICTTYFSGQYGDSINGQPHAWLLYGDLIIDITGDQFKYETSTIAYDIPVYVGTKDEFHSMFDKISQEDYCDERSNFTLEEEHNYGIIMSYLK